MNHTSNLHFTTNEFLRETHVKSVHVTFTWISCETFNMKISTLVTCISSFEVNLTRFVYLNLMWDWCEIPVINFAFVFVIYLHYNEYGPEFWRELNSMLKALLIKYNIMIFDVLITIPFHTLFLIYEHCFVMYYINVSSKIWC